MTARLEPNTHYVGRMYNGVAFLDIVTMTSHRVTRTTYTRFLLSRYCVSQVIILEVLRGALADTSPWTTDFKERIVMYNMLQKGSIEAAGPLHLRRIQFNHHQDLVEHWQQYWKPDAVHLNVLDLSTYYRKQ